MGGGDDDGECEGGRYTRCVGFARTQDMRVSVLMLMLMLMLIVKHVYQIV